MMTENITVMVSFNFIMGQMTGMFPRKKKQQYTDVFPSCLCDL